MRRITSFALLLAAAGCAPTPRPATRPTRPAPPAAAQPAPAPPPPLAADWRDWPVTPGTWRYGRDGASSFARYAPTGAAITCDNDHQVRVALEGRSSATPITIRTTSQARTLAAAPLGHPPTGVAVALSPGDPLLDAIAFSRGRFAIEQAGAPPLVLPAWAEVGRVIEDCRG